jgi:hypothetical protein
MNTDGTHSQRNNFSPVIDIRTKMKNLPTTSLGGENIKTADGFRHFLSGDTSIIGYEGYGYQLDQLEDNKLETLSLRNGKDLIRSHGMIIGSSPEEIIDNTYLITISNGTVIRANGNQLILSGINQPILIDDLDVGDVVKSGVLRYENSMLYPSLSLGLNFVIEKKKVSSISHKFYEIELQSFDNILIGQEMDGETSILCLSAPDQVIAA